MRGAGPCLLLAACAPPPAVAVDTGGAPDAAISIIYPPDGETVTLSPTCNLKVTIAVDIDHLVLVEPGSPEADGEGHWHLSLREDGSYIPVTNQFANIDEPGFTPGSILRPRVSLQSSSHADLDQYPAWEDQVEILLEDDAASPCVPPS